MRNRKKSLLYGACVAVALAAFTGCTTSSKPSDERSAGRATDDKAITKEVNNVLKNEPVYKFDGVDVQTFAGAVQLSGFVNTQAQKSRAEELAWRVPGVGTVINGIALKPVPLAPTGRPPQHSEYQPRVYSSPDPTQSSDAKQGAELK